MIQKNKAYKVRASVYPTPHANAEHTWLSSGRFPSYNYYKFVKFINFSVVFLKLK